MTIVYFIGYMRPHNMTIVYFIGYFLELQAVIRNLFAQPDNCFDAVSPGILPRNSSSDSQSFCTA